MSQPQRVLDAPGVAGLAALALVLHLARARLVWTTIGRLHATAGFAPTAMTVGLVVILAAIGCMVAAVLALSAVVRVLHLAIAFMRRRAETR